MIQRPPLRKSERALGLITCAALCATTLLAVAAAQRLWRGSVNIPFAYAGDGLSHSSLVKSVLDHGWYYHNINLNAPFGQDYRDFPMPDNFHLIVIRSFGLLGLAYPAALNLYYLLAYPLIALTCFWSLRQFAISRPVSATISFLYAIAPYHFFRGEEHLFLGAYYAVPLMCYLILAALTEKPLFSNRKWISTSLICLLVGSTSSYYSAFGLVLIAFVGLALLLRRGRASVLGPVFAISAIILATTVINVLPSLIYSHDHGRNPELAARVPEESETYSLKFAQLVLPMHDHRIDAFAHLRNTYDTRFPIPSEGSSMALGAIATFGFLWLLLLPFLSLVIPEKLRNVDGRHKQLAALALFALLVATTGGISTMISLFVTAEIRAWNRMSIYISFFSLAAVALLLDRLDRQTRRRVAWQGLMSRVPTLLLLGAIAAIGLLDQTSGRFIFPYAATTASYKSDDAFVRHIESTLPKASMIYQLPYIPFPENPPVVHMTDYDEFKGYLHSKTLRWSYGGLRGRHELDWQVPLAPRTPAQLLPDISSAGFSGLYIDRFGYADNAAALEQRVSSILGIPPFVSRDGRLSFFDLRAFKEQLSKTHPSAELNALRVAILHPLDLTFSSGFFGAESDMAHSWRWSTSKSRVVIVNSAKYQRQATLSMTLETGWPAPSNVRVQLPDGSTQSVAVSSKPVSVSWPVSIHTGTNVLRLSTDAPRVNTPDVRDLRLQVLDSGISEEVVSQVTAG